MSLYSDHEKRLSHAKQENYKSLLFKEYIMYVAHKSYMCILYNLHNNNYIISRLSSLIFNSFRELYNTK